jgi:formiminoglutamase
MSRLPILVSIPHGGWQAAPEIDDIWALSERDAFHDGDPFTARIYDFEDRVEVQLVMEYYRAVIDLNRREDDIAPKNPDGVIKSYTCYNVEVYKPGCLPGPDLQQVLLHRYYRPYHSDLNKVLQRRDLKLGVDCHSMAAVSPPIEKDAGTSRPLICLGNLGDSEGLPCEPFRRITAPPELVLFMRDEFRKVFAHEDVDLEVPDVATANVPFSGGYITQRIGGGPMPFVQIEMSRALYLSKPHFDEETLEIEASRIEDLNHKVFRVLQRTVENL